MYKLCNAIIHYLKKKVHKMIEAEIIEDSFKAPVLKDVKYNVSQTGLENLLDQYKEVPTIDPEGKDVAEQFKYVNDGRKAFVKARTSIEKTRKELKAPSMEYGRKVDSIAKEFQALIQAKELQLTTQCKIVENHERLKQEAYEESERVRRDAIREKINVIKDLPLKHFNSSSSELTQALESLRVITQEEYEEYYEDAGAIQETAIAQLQQARSNKIAVENAQVLQAKEDARQAEEQRVKDEELKAEQQALQAEREAMQKERNDMQREKDELQEQINLQNAEREAEALAIEQLKKSKELEEANEIARQAKKAQDIKDNKLKAKQTKELYDKIEAQIGMFKTARDVLNAIIDNKIDHIRWEV